MARQQLTTEQIAQMTDITLVNPDVTGVQLRELAGHIQRFPFAGTYVNACYVPEMKALLDGISGVLLGTGIGFPYGVQTLQTKIFEAKEAFRNGCAQLDLIINYGALRSGRDDYVAEEIRAMIALAEGRTIKVILEIHYLTDDEIKRACELAIEAGAKHVKTSTGTAPTGATLERIELIKSFVGERIGIKAAGGIRDLATIREMYKLGARLFGVGMNSAVEIMEECASTEQA